MLMWFDRNRQARQLLAMGISTVIIFTLMTFKMNILAPPPGVSGKFWMSILFSLAQNYLDIRLASRSTVMQVWKKEVQRLNQAGNHSKIWPNVLQLTEALKRQPTKKWDKESHHIQTLTNRFEALIDQFGPVLDCTEGYDDIVLFEELDWALELEGPSDLTAFLVSVICARVYYYRLKNNLFSPHLQNAIVMDEAGELFNVAREHHQDSVEYILSKSILPRARALGIGFICCSQEYDCLSRSLRANCDTQILVGGSLGRGEDTEAFARSNGLTREQLEFLMEI